MSILNKFFDNITNGAFWLCLLIVAVGLHFIFGWSIPLMGMIVCWASSIAMLIGAIDQSGNTYSGHGTGNANGFVVAFFVVASAFFGILASSFTILYWIG